MPAIARTPTTTPTAIPTLLVPPPDWLLDALEAVTTIVWPALVTTDGDPFDDDEPPFDVGVALAELLEAPSTSTSVLRPLKYTV